MEELSHPRRRPLANASGVTFDLEASGTSTNFDTNRHQSLANPVWTESVAGLLNST